MEKANEFLTQEEARAVVTKGLELAASAKTRREFSSAMRPVLSILKAMTQVGRVETAEQKRERLEAILAEIAFDSSQPAQGPGETSS